MKATSKTIVSERVAKIHLNAGKNICLKNGMRVKWININNHTCFAEDDKASKKYFDNESVIFLLIESLLEMKNRITLF